MAQLEASAARTTKPSSNVYTVMVLVAFVALAFAVGVVWWKNIQVTGDLQPAAGIKNPFYLVPQAPST